MARLVIDASLAAAWCFPDEQADYTNRVVRIVGQTIDPIAPGLWAYEIRNTILMGMKRGRITKDDARKLLVFLNDLDVQLFDPPSHDAVFSVADRHGLSFYSDHTLTSRLRLSPQVLEKARQELLDRDLIAYQLPLVQVLALPASGVHRRPEPGQGLMLLGDVFRQVAAAATPDKRRPAL